jgi:tetratricopeptide (TPR) repeat protein
MERPSLQLGPLLHQIVRVAAVASEVCAKEVAFAASLNKRFAPLVHQRVGDMQVPKALSRLNFIFFDDEARFGESLERLIDALATDIAWIRKHTEYGEAARHWAAADRPGGLLLRSPVLEEAERWIASRPASAPAPTAETQTFVAESRRGATRRRNILTGSLAAGLVLALALAGLAYWQRSVAIEQRQIAEQQRKRAEDTLTAATRTANSLVFDLAERFQNSLGIPLTLVKDILDRARALQEQLIKSGEVAPDLRSSEAAALYKTSEALSAIGDTSGALTAAEQARQILAELLAQNPGSTDYQRFLSTVYKELGDVKRTQGDLAGALKSYEDSLGVDERLVKSDPGNFGWQRDLSVSYNKIGDVQVAQGDLAGALKSYREGLAIMDRVARAEPDNAGWQRDLSVSYDRVGNVQDNLPDALKSYRDSLAIRDRLARADPGNSGRLGDLSVSYERVGDVLAAQGNLPEALKSYRESLSIRERLVRADPGTASWRRGLWVSYNKVGDGLKAQGDTTGALKFYHDSLAIVERLAKSDPGNAGWQRDLVISCVLIADVDRSQAQAMLTRALEIANTMQAKGMLSPSDAWMPADLARRIAQLSQ